MTLSQAPAPPGRGDITSGAHRAAGLPGPGQAGGGGRHRAARPATPPGPPGAAAGLPGILVAGAHGGAGTSVTAVLLRGELAAWPGGPVPVRALPAFPDADPGEIARRSRLRVLQPGPLIL